MTQKDQTQSMASKSDDWDENPSNRTVKRLVMEKESDKAHGNCHKNMLDDINSIQHPKQAPEKRIHYGYIICPFSIKELILSTKSKVFRTFPDVKLLEKY